MYTPQLGPPITPKTLCAQTGILKLSPEKDSALSDKLFENEEVRLD